MTDEDIKAIEARLVAVPHWHSNGPEGCSADIAALLAEVERLRAALREVLKGGEHEGPCDQLSEYDRLRLACSSSKGATQSCTGGAVMNGRCMSNVDRT